MPGQLFHQRAEHLRRRGIIAEDRPWDMHRYPFKEGARPVLSIQGSILRAIIAGGHAQHVAKGNLPQQLRRMLLDIFGKVIHDPMIQIELVFLCQYANGQGNHRLAH